MLHSIADRSRKVRRMALAGMVAAALMVASVMALHPPSAHAGLWSEKYQPAKSWSIVEEIGAGLHEQFARAETTSTICVGPIQKSGGGYVTPYGWGCHAGGEVEWEYPALTAFPAFYNPNSNQVNNPWGGSAF
jgi:hypothetical protein